MNRHILICLVLPAVCALSDGTAVAARPVGVVDSKLVSSQFWVRPWAADWASDRLVKVFQQNGVEAEVIGADVLKDAERLSRCRAVMIPGDHKSIRKWAPEAAPSRETWLPLCARAVSISCRWGRLWVAKTPYSEQLVKSKELAG